MTRSVGGTPRVVLQRDRVNGARCGWLAATLGLGCTFGGAPGAGELTAATVAGDTDAMPNADSTGAGGAEGVPLPGSSETGAGVDETGPGASSSDSSGSSDGEPGAPTICDQLSVPYTGMDQVIDLPADASMLQIKAWGAGGNGDDSCPKQNPQAGGVGGFATGTLMLEGGESITVVVGKGGAYYGMGVPEFGFGGGAGGGLSGVFVGDSPVTEGDQARAAVVAGGGGSAAREVCAAGGPGNHPGSGGQPTMQGALVPIGGGGGFAGGLGGDDRSAARGGTGFLAAPVIDGALEFGEPAALQPPRVDDEHYVAPAGTAESNG
ncbi:MAG: hypothetical protein AAF721_39260, partial [Myxococcota bacterium]